MEYGDYYWGSYRDYYRDPFPHSLLSTRQSHQLGRPFVDDTEQAFHMSFVSCGCKHPSAACPRRGPAPTLRVQVPNNHILSQILTYITTILNPSTLVLGPLDPWGYKAEAGIEMHARINACSSSSRVLLLTACRSTKSDQHLSKTARVM